MCADTGGEAHFQAGQRRRTWASSAANTPASIEALLRASVSIRAQRSPKRRAATVSPASADALGTNKKHRKKHRKNTEQTPNKHRTNTEKHRVGRQGGVGVPGCERSRRCGVALPGGPNYRTIAPTWSTQPGWRSCCCHPGPRTAASSIWSPFFLFK